MADQDIGDFAVAFMDRHPSLVKGTGLPVFARGSMSGNVYLGIACDHQHAESLGLVRGISCAKISRAVTPNDPQQRKYFVLH